LQSGFVIAMVFHRFKQLTRVVVLARTTWVTQSSLEEVRGKRIKTATDR
jgi:hypothetical protein